MLQQSSSSPRKPNVLDSHHSLCRQLRPTGLHSTHTSSSHPRLRPISPTLQISSQRCPRQISRNSLASCSSSSSSNISSNLPPRQRRKTLYCISCYPKVARPRNPISPPYSQMSADTNPPPPRLFHRPFRPMSTQHKLRKRRHIKRSRQCMDTSSLARFRSRQLSLR